MKTTFLLVALCLTGCQRSDERNQVANRRDRIDVLTEKLEALAAKQKVAEDDTSRLNDRLRDLKISLWTTSNSAARWQAGDR